MKKFLMVILMAAAAMAAAPHVSAAAAVDPKVQAVAEAWITHLELAPAARQEQRQALNMALRAQGYAPVRSDKEYANALALMQKRAVGASRDEKIAKLTELLRQPASSSLKKNAGAILALIGVGGLVAADYAGVIGEDGKLDAPAVLWTKMPSGETVRSWVSPTAWKAWYQQDAVPVVETVPVVPVVGDAVDHLEGNGVAATITGGAHQDVAAVPSVTAGLGGADHLVTGGVAATESLVGVSVVPVVGGAADFNQKIMCPLDGEALELATGRFLAIEAASATTTELTVPVVPVDGDVCLPGSEELEAARLAAELAGVAGQLNEAATTTELTVPVVPVDAVTRHIPGDGVAATESLDDAAKTGLTNGSTELGDGSGRTWLHLSYHLRNFLGLGQ